MSSITLPIRSSGTLKRNETIQPVRGLGDIVAKFAEPIKNTIIKHGPNWAKVAVSNCNCDKRRQILNSVFPL